MNNFLDILEDLLKQDERFVAEDGSVMKSKAYDLGVACDTGLFRLLLSNEDTKAHFFKDVDGIMVFDSLKFGWVVTSKEFLPDSYTKYKNKIGLVDNNGRSISQSKDVCLVWPYKDCVLEGGQTKEDQKRNEIFYNETLAPDEVSRLLYPKVFTKVKKYTSDGESTVTQITDNDNLIIKGNNLLALSSLLKRYEGEVKCIYIDVPYNTGSDSFGYNDKFNHSTWLTFMKNRLEMAYRLLSKQGCCFLQVDHHELAYINILMDEIFGINNKVQIISVKAASTSGFKAVNPGPIDVTEYILFYTKDKPSFEFKKNYVEAGYNKNYNKYLEKNNSENTDDWEFIPIKQKLLFSIGKTEKELKEQFGVSFKPVFEQMISGFAFNNADLVISIRDLHKPTETMKRLQEESKINRGKIYTYYKQNGEKTYLYNGGAVAFYSSKLQNLDGNIVVTELLSDFWNHISWAGIAKEGGVSLKNGKKPEKLLKQIFEISTNNNDLVMDFFLGSGTTCAVAHKLGLRYIGIEQLDYNENDSMVRMKNVINGDLTGISKAVNWKGGGSFIYCELKELNEQYISKAQAVSSEEELLALFAKVKESGFISQKVRPKDINTDIKEFTDLSFEQKKQVFVELINKNMLYVNYCDIDDKEFNVSEVDKIFTNSFYGRG